MTREMKDATQSLAKIHRRNSFLISTCIMHMHVHDSGPCNLLNQQSKLLRILTWSNSSMLNSTETYFKILHFSLPELIVKTTFTMLIIT